MKLIIKNKQLKYGDINSFLEKENCTGSKWCVLTGSAKTLMLAAKAPPPFLLSRFI